MNLPSDVMPTKTLGVERRRGVVHSSMDSSLIWMTDVKLEYPMTMYSSNVPGGQSSGDRLSFLFKVHVFSGIARSGTSVISVVSSWFFRMWSELSLKRPTNANNFVGLRKSVDGAIFMSSRGESEWKQWISSMLSVGTLL